MLVIELEKHWYKECATSHGNEQSTPFDKSWTSLLDMSIPTVQGTEAQYNKTQVYTKIIKMLLSPKATSSSPSRQGPNLFIPSDGQVSFSPR